MQLARALLFLCLIFLLSACQEKIATYDISQLENELRFLESLQLTPLPTLTLPSAVSVAETRDPMQKMSFSSEPVWGAMKQATFQINYQKANDILETLIKSKILTAEARYASDDQTNQLWIEDTPSALRDVTAIIHQFDQAAAQIKIVARIVFINSDYEKSLGFSFSSPESSGEGLPSIVSTGSNVVKLIDSQMLDVELAALEAEGEGKVISKPSLVTSNRTSALIKAGEEVPYQETTSSGATSVHFKQAALSLNVTPSIMPEGKILLYLQVNQDKPSTQMVLGVPTIKTREIKTQALVPEGHTMILGGVYEEAEGQGVKRVPLLSAIPVAGKLFTYHRKERSKGELIIFITPSIERE